MKQNNESLKSFLAKRLHSKEENLVETSTSSNVLGLVTRFFQEVQEKPVYYSVLTSKDGESLLEIKKWTDEKPEPVVVWDDRIMIMMETRTLLKQVKEKVAAQEISFTISPMEESSYRFEVDFVADSEKKSKIMNYLEALSTGKKVKFIQKDISLTKFEITPLDETKLFYQENVSQDDLEEMLVSFGFILN